MKKNASRMYYLIFSLIAVIIAGFIATLLLITSPPIHVVLLHSAITFSSIISLFIIPKPFFKSQNWFYKLLFSAVYCTAMYFKANDYIQVSIADNEYDIIKWLLLWGIPVLIYYAFSLADKLLTKQYDKKKRLGIIWKSWAVYYSPAFKRGKDSPKIKLRISGLINTLIFLTATLCIAATIYLKLQFPSTDLSVILFTLRFIQGGITKEIAHIIAGFVIALVIANGFFIVSSVIKSNQDKYELRSPDKSESFVMTKSEMTKGILKEVPLIAMLASSVFLLANQVSLKTYIKNQRSSSTIYEDHYIKPDMSLLTFPEKKKNLIYISAESIENAYTSFANGGIQDNDHIPNLIKLASDNINFSNDNDLGGQSIFYPAINYTMGSCVAQTSGISFMPFFSGIINQENPTNAILPSAVKLEKLLSDAGYNQTFIRGEKASFSGIDIYFGKEKNSELIDFFNAVKKGFIPERYDHFGFDDAKLFDISKQVISQLAQKDEPFAVTLYTLDTHMPEGGYRCKLCDDSVTDDRSACIECSDRQITNFVHWVQEQPFADDTVIIIYGDHLSPVEARTLFRNKTSDYTRTTYNCIINAQKEPVNAKNRLFTPMDMFPTTLSAIGVDIEGDRLGLGTDLFSDKPTLCEELGKDKFLQQIQLNSKYFQKEFWKED
ncbi:MAG: LTA synthase family protein [Ruminococcus sp.]|uniref:LTA synthase family protein n=1 Tax=Ruminococcus sp. TaxID=41978 RepID=UPI0025EC8280|nr:LTA synthase family protein [Ruminococcus sp.]MCR4795790.1 LTA synthase family protein [Ruminococcus sp.]